MKRPNALDALWRDGIERQCLYALFFGILGAYIMYVSIIKPGQARVTFLLQEKERLDHQVALEKLQKTEKGVEQRDEVKSCAWKKEASSWVMSGHFPQVYECILQGVPDDMIVDNMAIRKHVMGVKVTLLYEAD